MQLSKLKLVTIIADDSLRHLLEEHITELGAKGYTVSHVEGKGKTGSRDSAWSGENVKIETIVPDVVCDRIISKIANQFFPSYAVIVYISDVEVLRSTHFR
ncbi:MAG TPA: P-II family nitrogen regulator [Chryseosolibacter sp.]